MTLKKILSIALKKDNFLKVSDYADFCESYLAFITNGIQAEIVSKNENHYHFFQYKKDGNYNVTRPINKNLMLSEAEFNKAKSDFLYAIKHIRDINEDTEIRLTINKFVYTCQQSIGATLDSLPSGKSNSARKINGDLFERFIRLIISDIGVSVREGTVKIPITSGGTKLFDMSYQHDLIVENSGVLAAIGSVKTSSKDRIDKIFIDKFLYNSLTNLDTPHFAVFLNDVQRKGKLPGGYGINTTFLTGHFKGYTVKLNPLDGVYYCDIRPTMENDRILSEQIRTFDHLLVSDIWNFVKK